MTPGSDVTRIALVVHPTRRVDGALQALQGWARRHGLDVVQLRAQGSSERKVVPWGDLAPSDLVVALGGDGTVLSALRSSAEYEVPVLGVACGSLGALTAVPAERLADALERVRAGHWRARRLPAISIDADGDAHDWALNDFVVIRHGAGQVVVEVTVDDELYARVAGDGLVVATALGSSAYSMAAGGPILFPTTPAVVCTPVATHGGSVPPLVIPATSSLRVAVHPSFAGFDVEIDGHTRALDAVHYRLSLHEDKVVLVSFGELGMGISELRRRGLIVDSPRILARDAATARGDPERRDAQK
jgi:NAD+ kinase